MVMVGKVLDINNNICTDIYMDINKEKPLQDSVVEEARQTFMNAGELGGDCQAWFRLHAKCTCCTVWGMLAVCLLKW